MDGQVVLITGGSVGFSVVTTIQLAKLSAKLAIVGRRDDSLREVAKHCENASGLRPLIIESDLNDDSEAERVVRETIERYGKLDVLVNNAGLSAPGGITTIPVDLFELVVNNNIKSVFSITQHALSYLIPSRGCIINVPPQPPRDQSVTPLAYNMCKVALNNFTKCIATELKSEGVNVNSVLASFPNPDDVCYEEFETMFAAYVKGERENENPNKLVRQGMETASLIAFLADERGKNITGATFVLGVKDAFCDKFTINTNQVVDNYYQV